MWNNNTRSDSVQNQIRRESKKNEITSENVGANRIQGNVVVKEISEEKAVRKILEKPRNMAYIKAIEKADEMTEEDFNIVEMVQEHIEKQQEEQVGEADADKLLYTLSECFITGCEVHTFSPSFIHYGPYPDTPSEYEKPIHEMPERMRKGYSFYCKNRDCSCIEIYEKHICIVEKSGKTTVVEE